tara:strand:- start:777 stop:1334 length:558 start_codon:yes stop_codon:yes gene_type:complete
MDLLKKTLKASAIGAITASLAFGVLDAKAETAGTTITATVQNAFTFTETTALTFGTIIAVNDATDTSTIVMNTAGTPAYNNPGAARLTEVVAGTNGVFDITAAAPSAGIDVTYPASVTLSCGTCSGSQEDFTVNTFTDNSVAGTVTTDGAGAFTINVGATLTTINSANAYEDGAYSGAFTVTANY